MSLPAEPFDATEAAAPRVDQKSLVTIRQNRYSVPVALAGLKVCGADRRARDHDQPTAARRSPATSGCTARFGTSAQLDHYLELLRRKPGGLEHSLALAQERERGAWPACFDELWAALTERYGRSDAARQMVDVVLLCREHGPERVELAVRGALAAGAIDGRAVAVLARRAETAPPAAPAPLTDLEPRLARHERTGARSDRLRPAARRHPMTTPTRNAQTAALEALIEAHAIELKLPTVRRRFRTLATEATREQQTPIAYLAALLGGRDGRARRAPRETPPASTPASRRSSAWRTSASPTTRTFPRPRSPRSPRAPGSTTARP